MNKYYIRDNKWVKSDVPSTKQIENNTTNKEIECMICNKFVPTYVSIIDMDRVVREYYEPTGYMCYPCADRQTMNKYIAFMKQDGTRYTPELFSSGLPLDQYGNVSDPTKDRIGEINKHRNRTKAYIKWCRKGGLLSKRRSKSNSKSKDNGIDPMMALANMIYKEIKDEDV